MALQSSGAISLSNIQTEFGGTNPISLSEYYSKGNAPASGEIQLAADFYGTSNTVTLDFVRRTQYTPTASTTLSNVAIGTANPNRMVILQGNVVSGSHNIVNNITACTIGGVTATIFGTFSTGQIVYAKVPTGTTANIVLTYNGSGAQMRLQVNTINTVNSGPTLQSTGNTPNPGSITFTQNPVDPEGIFMWGTLIPASAYQSGYSLTTSSAGGVDVVPGYAASGGTSPSAVVTRATMAVSETANSDSRFVRVTQSPGGKAAFGCHGVYFKAN